MSIGGDLRMEWLGSKGWRRQWRFLLLGLGCGLSEKPHFLLMTLIPDNSFGTVDAFPISARCYVMIVLLGIFHISPLLFLL